MWRNSHWIVVISLMGWILSGCSSPRSVMQPQGDHYIFTARPVQIHLENGKIREFQEREPQIIFHTTAVIIQPSTTASEPITILWDQVQAITIESPGYGPWIVAGAVGGLLGFFGFLQWLALVAGV